MLNVEYRTSNQFLIALENYETKLKALESIMYEKNEKRVEEAIDMGST